MKKDPEARIDVLEKRCAIKDRRLDFLTKQNAELTRRLASMQAQIQALSTSINRLR